MANAIVGVYPERTPGETASRGRILTNPAPMPAFTQHRANTSELTFLGTLQELKERVTRLASSLVTVTGDGVRDFANSSDRPAISNTQSTEAFLARRFVDGSSRPRARLSRSTSPTWISSVFSRNY